MRIEVTFQRTTTKERKVITIKAPSVADGLVSARVLLYNELDDRKLYLQWGVLSVRKVES